MPKTQPQQLKNTPTALDKGTNENKKNSSGHNSQSTKLPIPTKSHDKTAAVTKNDSKLLPANESRSSNKNEKYFMRESQLKISGKAAQKNTPKMHDNNKRTVFVNRSMKI